MSTYIKLSTMEYPRHEGDIRLEHPEIAEAFACPETYAVVEFVSPPEITDDNLRCEEAPPIFEKGVWKMVWNTRQATQEEINWVNSHPFKPE